MLWTARRQASASISECLSRLSLTATRNPVVRAWWGYGERATTSMCRATYSTTTVRWRRKICIHDVCSKQASFGIVRGKPLYCKTHKLEGMENVVMTLCAYHGCKTNPVFNHPGEKSGLYCLEHKESGMKDVVNRECRFKGCRKQAVYNYLGEKQGLYCSEHQHVHMEDVTHRLCKFDGCNTQPVYNYPGEKRGLYCAKHKLDNMEDVQNKRCAHEGCRTSIRGRGVRYCSKHRNLAVKNA